MHLALVDDATSKPFILSHFGKPLPIGPPAHRPLRLLPKIHDLVCALNPPFEWAGFSHLSVGVPDRAETR